MCANQNSELKLTRHHLLDLKYKARRFHETKIMLPHTNYKLQ